MRCNLYLCAVNRTGPRSLETSGVIPNAVPLPNDVPSSHFPMFLFSILLTLMSITQATSKGEMNYPIQDNYPIQFLNSRGKKEPVKIVVKKDFCEHLCWSYDC